MGSVLATVITGDARRIAALSLILVGAVLLIGSFTDGFTTKWVSAKWVSSRQLYALGLGAILFLSGVLFLWRSQLIGPLPADLSSDIMTRYYNLSAAQAALFRKVRFDGPKFLVDIAESRPVAEAYYRLEHLILLGLIVKTNVATPEAPVWKYEASSLAMKIGSGTNHETGGRSAERWIRKHLEAEEKRPLDPSES